MMLNKATVWIFGADTIEAMRDDIDLYLDDIKDESPPPDLANIHLLRDLLRIVYKEKVEAPV